MIKIATRIGSGLCATVLAMAASPLAFAGAVDISNTPLSSTRSVQVKPNIMLLMDTSASIGYTHMPDEVELNMTPMSVGYKNPVCNTLYYNPTVHYDLPKNSDGTFFPSATFTHALINAFDPLSTAYNDLTSQFQAYEIGTIPGRKTLFRATGTWPADPPDAAYYYVYSGSTPLVYGATACNDLATGGAFQPASASPGGTTGTWTRTYVGPGDQANFANWYVYYRTRLLLTKTAMSLSFNALNDTYRVGFITVDPKVGSNTEAINGDAFLALNDFSPGTGAQRDKWYSKLFAQKPGGSSPAREGLARVGRYYGNKFDGINQGMGGVDPVQYSCQRNFTILTTDGYWNAQTEARTLSGGFIGGPVDLTGTTLVADSSTSLNPDGTYTPLATGFTPYGVWDGASDHTTTITDRVRSFRDQICGVSAGSQVSTSNITSYTQHYSTTTTQVPIVTSQTTTTQVQDWSKTELFKSSQAHYQQSTTQYTKQDLQYLMYTQQNTVATYPFTTKVETSYTVQTDQWMESSHQVTRTDTPWTKVDTTNYTIEQTQYQAQAYYYLEGNSQYYYGQSRMDVQTYRTIQTTGEEPVPVAVCVPITGQVLCTKEVSSPWAPGTCPSTVQTPTASTPQTEGPPDSNNVVTQCRFVVLQPYAPVASPCTITNTTVNGVTTVCALVPQNTPAAVKQCTYGEGTTAPQGPNFVVTTCTKMPTMLKKPVDPSDPACVNNQDNFSPYTTRSCANDGPLRVPANGSAVCDPANNSSTNSPNYVNTVCTKSAPMTTYVSPQPASNCQNHTAQAGNGAQVACTPYGTGAPYAVLQGTCSTGDVGVGASAVYALCNQNANATVAQPVQACTSPSVQASPPYKIFVCQDNGPSVVAAHPSPQCPQGTTPGTMPNWVSSTCNVNGPTTTYLPNYPSTAVCNTHTADSADGTTRTCSTPAATAAANGACPSGATPGSTVVQGTGSGQVTVVCGAQAASATAPVQFCTIDDPNNPNTDANGLTTHCSLVNSGEYAVPTCTPADGVAHFDPNYPYSGSICKLYAPAPAFRSTAGCAVEGTDPPTQNNSYVTTTCNTIVVTPEAPSAPCTVGPPVDSGGASHVFTSCTLASSTPFTPSVPECLNNPPPSFDSGTGYTTTCERRIYKANTGTDGCQQGPTSDPTIKNLCFGPSPTPGFFDQTGGAVCQNIAGNDGNGWRSVTCGQPINGSPVPTAACSAGWSYATTPDYTATFCTVDNPTPPVPDSACTPGVNPFSNGTQTVCQESARSTPVPSLCPGVGSGPFRNGSQNVYCSTGSNSGLQRFDTVVETVTKQRYSNSNPVGIPDVQSSTIVHNQPEDNSCHVAGINPLNPVATPSDQHDAGYPTAPVSGPASGGSYNSLADVAQYYYVNNLRAGDSRFPTTGTSSVTPSGSGLLDDRNTAQHMTTYTIALGVSGTLTYQGDYKTATSGDFASIVGAAKSWPQWPDSTIDYTNFTLWEDKRSIDDFWHTAVNGRGTYFSAHDPRSVATGVAGALAQLTQQDSEGSAATYSNIEPTATDNFIFQSFYRTGAWTGDVTASTISLTTGKPISPPYWTNSAGALLDQQRGAFCDNRTIYFIDSTGSAATLVDFSWNTQKCDGTPAMQATGPFASALVGNPAAANFSSSQILNFSNYQQMTDGTGGSPDQRGQAGNGSNLVNFLRGQSGHEQFSSGVDGALFRTRAHVLGDVIDAQPVYVKAPIATYGDNNYATFKSNHAGRKPMLYVGANDGMLHAFNVGDGTLTDATRGAEVWAIIPSAVMPNLYKLGDNAYSELHQFYVDGTPIAADVSDGGGNWRSILVGGLNAGGRGYYAIDITDPTLPPTVLWEFKNGACYVPGNSATAGSDCNLGLTFGTPIVTKIPFTGYTEGRWVVLVTSGYNNISPGDGNGYLYVLDALTGKILKRLPTGAGTSANPSNLGQINTYVDDVSVNNLALRAYGGDMLGNIWRFDINNSVTTLVGQATDSQGHTQPITVRPELAELNGQPMVFVGTGRLLGASDVTDLSTQSIYGIVDTLTGSPVYSSLRDVLNPMVISEGGLTLGGTPQPGSYRTIACSTASQDAAKCALRNGWVIDLPDPGERVNVNMAFALSTLVVGSNVPNNSPCSTAGYSWLNYIDFATGTSNGSFSPPGTSTSATHVSEFLSDSLTVGLGIIRLPDQTFKAPIRVSGAGDPDTPGMVMGSPFPPVPKASGKRISWREIAQ